MAKQQPFFDELITTREAGADLGISSTRVTILITDGRLPAKKMGKTWVIRRADLELVRERPTGKHLTDWRAEKKQAKPDGKKKPSSRPKA